MLFATAVSRAPFRGSEPAQTTRLGIGRLLSGRELDLAAGGKPGHRPAIRRGRRRQISNDEGGPRAWKAAVGTRAASLRAQSGRTLPAASAGRASAGAS